MKDLTINSYVTDLSEYLHQHSASHVSSTNQLFDRRVLLQVSLNFRLKLAALTTCLSAPVLHALMEVNV